MKTIKLTQNKFAVVDDEDCERLNHYKWYANWDGYNWYAIRNSPRRGGKRVKIHMHREILDATEDIKVDHRNSDGLCNFKENLRLCTHQQNGFNRRYPSKNNKLGIKGVYWHKQYKKFSAQIKLVVN